MRQIFLITLFVMGVLVTSFTSSSLSADNLVYQGTEGPGVGKHIVLLAGDHEYRSEETIPALARILAKHYGFRCTVLFTVDPKTGDIDPTANHMPGLEALETADLMVIFLRFKDLPDDQMKHIVSYLDRAGPVVGLRTSTHAFKIDDEDATYAKYSFRHKSDDYHFGFGRQVLGESWAGHYGKNHEMSTRLDIPKEVASHPILTGITRSPWVQAGGYWTNPVPGCTVLAVAQPLNGMTIDSTIAKDKKPCPGAWVRKYKNKQGKTGRVFTTTYGASADLLNDEFRRMLVNACHWTIGLNGQIKPTSNISFVGPYHPTRFCFGGYCRGIKPLMLEGWNSPILVAKPANQKSDDRDEKRQ